MMVKAYLDGYHKISVTIKRQFCEGKSEHFYLLENDKISELVLLEIQEENEVINYTLDYTNELEIGYPYQVMVVNGYRVPLEYRFIVKSKRFNEEFYYPGNDLGCIVTDKYTKFALWAPTASEVKLDIEYKDKHKMVDMRRTEQGVYRLTLSPRLIGAKYHYMVKVNGKWNSCIDPYGKCSTANSNDSVVFDRHEYKVEKIYIPEIWKYTNAIIYETNVRDFSEDGTFKSFQEKIDYLVDLGITNVQLMPVNDFGSVDELHPDLFYNWGYDPVSYQVLEGSYSSDVSEPTQVIKDFVGLVSELHEKGLRVNLDVVLNHVYEMSTSSFELTVPYYFFRYYQNGQLSDGSYCGNDIDSKMSMARKYIVDTLVYYVDQFDVDGFRLDLMGLMDIETINVASTTLKAMKPEIMLYGEGWDMVTALDPQEKATSDNHEQLPQIAFFNDKFRDVIKGSAFDPYALGYGSGNVGLINDAIASVKGLDYSLPEQSINYVECHDNMTVYDKLHICCLKEGEENIVERCRLLMSFVLLSQGIPFIHSGQEFCRSKNNLSNSYNKGDEINKIKESDKEKYHEVIEYTKQLIRLRKKLKIVKNRDSIINDVNITELDGSIVYTLENCLDNQQITIIFNPTLNQIKYTFKGGRKIILDKKGEKNELAYGDILVEPISVLVLGSKLDD